MLFCIISYIKKTKIVNEKSIKKLKLMDFIDIKKEVESILSVVFNNTLSKQYPSLEDNESFDLRYNYFINEFFNKLVSSNKDYLINSKVLKSEFLNEYNNLISFYYNDLEKNKNFFNIDIKESTFGIIPEYSDDFKIDKKFKDLYKLFRELYISDLETYNKLKAKIIPKKLGDTSYIFENSNYSIISKETLIIFDKFQKILKSKSSEYIKGIDGLDNISKKKIDDNINNPTSDYILKSFPTSPKVLENQLYYPLFFKMPKKMVTEKMLIDIKNLIKNYPHFKDVIEHISLELTLKFKNNACFNLSPIMILGDFGIGKNSFVNSLNEILSFYGNIINFSSLYTSFEITGLANSYCDSTPGFLSNTILKNNISNPLIIVDEFDKLSCSSKGGLYAPFYDLLEKQSKSSFYENYFGTYFNFENLSIIALVNDLSTVPKGIKERFIIFTVKNPKRTVFILLVKVSCILKNSLISE